MKKAPRRPLKNKRPKKRKRKHSDMTHAKAGDREALQITKLLRK